MCSTWHAVGPQPEPPSLGPAHRMQLLPGGSRPWVLWAQPRREQSRGGLREAAPRCCLPTEHWAAAPETLPVLFACHLPPWVSVLHLQALRLISALTADLDLHVGAGTPGLPHVLSFLSRVLLPEALAGVPIHFYRRLATCVSTGKGGWAGAGRQLCLQGCLAPENLGLSGDR